jgi:hypothetical protein
LSTSGDNTRPHQELLRYFFNRSPFKVVTCWLVARDEELLGLTPIQLIREKPKMMKILIGHDGSQSADAALVDLQRAGLPVEAEALVVSVADVMMVSATPAYELAGDRGCT